MPPANAMTGFLYRAASCATPTGALPIAVCASMRPSPVTTRSAARIFSASPVSSMTICTPDSRLAPRNVRRAKPMPPAAPEPGYDASLSEKTVLASDAYSRSQPSMRRMLSASAPFCGPYTALQPFSPHRGFSTSHATRNVQS